MGFGDFYSNGNITLGYQWVGHLRDGPVSWEGGLGGRSHDCYCPRDYIEQVVGNPAYIIQRPLAPGNLHKRLIEIY